MASFDGESWGFGQLWSAGHECRWFKLCIWDKRGASDVVRSSMKSAGFVCLTRVVTKSSLPIVSTYRVGASPCGDWPLRLRRPIGQESCKNWKSSSEDSVYSVWLLNIVESLKRWVQQLLPWKKNEMKRSLWRDRKNVTEHLNWRQQGCDVFWKGHRLQKNLQSRPNTPLWVFSGIKELRIPSGRYTQSIWSAQRVKLETMRAQMEGIV